MLIVKFIKLQSKAKLNYVGGWTDGRGGPVDSLHSTATFSLTQWSQNYTAMQGWPFNYVDYRKPDFYLHTNPWSHTKTFVYSETAQGSACAVFTAGSGPKFLCICLMQGNQPGAHWSHMGHGMCLPGSLLCISAAAVAIGTSGRKRAVLVPRQVELPLLLPRGPGMQIQNLHQISGTIIVPVILI